MTRRYCDERRVINVISEHSVAMSKSMRASETKSKDGVKAGHDLHAIDMDESLACR